MNELSEKTEKGLSVEVEDMTEGDDSFDSESVRIIYYLNGEKFAEEWILKEDLVEIVEDKNG